MQIKHELGARTIEIPKATYGYGVHLSEYESVL